MSEKLNLELPWGYDGEDTVASQDWDGDGYSVFPVDKDGNCTGWIADVTDEESAAFIVQACNMHDELIEALKSLVNGYDDENLRFKAVDMRDRFEKAKSTLNKATKEG